jgi:hypothetical protein
MHFRFFTGEEIIRTDQQIFIFLPIRNYPSVIPGYEWAVNCEKNAKKNQLLVRAGLIKTVCLL